MSALFKGMLSFFILLKQSSTFFPHQTRDKKTKLFINQREKRILNTTFKLPLFGGTTFKIIHRKWEWGRWKRFTFYIPRRNKSRMFQDPGSGSGWPRPTATPRCSISDIAPGGPNRCVLDPLCCLSTRHACLGACMALWPSTSFSFKPPFPNIISCALHTI